MSDTAPVLGGYHPELGWPAYQQTEVERWRGNFHQIEQDYVAEEVPVALVYNGSPHVVMLITPTNIEEFALGFSITEGIIQQSDELLSIKIYNRADGIEVHLQIPSERFACMAEKGRNMSGRTGCGLCGATTLKQAMRKPGELKNNLKVNANDIIGGLSQLRDYQKLNRFTGSVHGAAWIVPGEGVSEIREDVGRHNALDKLIGCLVKGKRSFNEGFLIITSRASFEMVQKAAFVGINILVAISAPTGLAIRMANELGLTLLGFAREDQYVIYSHPYRILHQSFLV